MNAPLIGLTTSRTENSHGIPIISVNETYVQSILRAGGLPVLVPIGLSPSQLEELSSRLQGILFTGGGDIDPARFNGVPHPRVYGIDPERDALEFDLVHKAATDGTPFLGICRGAQVVNVALGGSLYTDIKDQRQNALKHNWSPGHPRDHRAHPLQVESASHLAGILGSLSPQVNSLHHQGIQVVAPALQAAAYAPDGLVEAVELPHHPFGLAVQWHPEWLPDDEAMQALFRAFVAACQDHH